MPPLHEVLPPPVASPEALVSSAAQPGRLRALALPILDAVLAAPERANPLMRMAFRRERRLGSHERRLAKDLIVAVLRHAPLIDRVIGQAEPRSLALWLGALVATRGLPAAEAAEALGRDLFGPLEHARAALDAACEGLSPVEALALAAALPVPVARALVEGLGEAEAVALAVAFNARAPITVRANLRKVDREGLIAALAAEGLTARPCALASAGCVVDGPANLLATRAHRQGLFELQDEGSQLIAELVQPPRGGLVVDLCAGAAGKALAIAAELPRGARVLGFDVRGLALDQGLARVQRAGVGGQVQLQAIEEEGAPPVAPESAARVLVDAPCSGTGTLRRNPAVRWNLGEARLRALEALQARLLRQGAALVRPGGRLVYATCSVLPAENRDQVEAFLAEAPGWRRVPVREVLGAARAGVLEEAGDLVTLPHRHGCDGFYAALLQRDR